MRDLEFAKEFVQKALETSGSFDITSKDKFVYSFMQHQINDAKYIYLRTYCRDKAEALSSLKEREMRLVAIVAGGEVYLVDDFYVGMRSATSEDHDAVGAKPFYTELRKLNEETVGKEAFTEWYESLPYDSDTTLHSDEERLKSDARRHILRGTSETVSFKDFEEKASITEEQYASILCEITSLKDIIAANLEKISEQVSSWKTRAKMVNDLMKDETLVSDWEMDMNNALRSIDAKMVSVTFVRNDVTAEGKIAVNTLIKLLELNQDIDAWDFETTTSGQKVMDKFGLKRFQYLYLNDISKISFRGKVIYDRENEK